jgi:hypothetical protein
MEGNPMSSSSSEICPRSVLRYRPIDLETSPTIQPWVRASRRLKKTQPAASPSPSTMLLTHTPSGLASLIILGMLLTLLLILIGQQAIGWTTNTLTDWQYGTPRTFQTDAYVGHGDSQHKSHFIALNNDGQVEVIEFPGNDATHAHIFFGPRLSGPQADQYPVTLRFVDSGQSGYPNMIIQVQGISETFLNRHGTFQQAAQ